MMTIIDYEAREERARDLAKQDCNGLKRILVVGLDGSVSPSIAHFVVQFHNDLHLSALLSDVALGTAPDEVFSVSGGQRIRGGRGRGRVQVTNVSASPVDAAALRLTVQPIGDYSTYTLRIRYANIDPFFDTLTFKFRPGCFSTECDVRRATPAKSAPPLIDYLAKDYDSFRHALIVALQQRVPGWTPTSEADFSMVLIDLFSAAADELSDFQDRVTHEAYLSRARSRVSLARHARMMDYHIHQGNQATTWLALRVAEGVSELPATMEASVPAGLGSAAVIFRSQAVSAVHALFNDIELHTWAGARTGLAAGAREADLSMPSESSAETVRDLILQGDIRFLLIQEHLHPGTGNESGRDPTKRQLLTLEVDATASIPAVGRDPVTGQWYVSVRWREEDRLQRDYCFLIGSTDAQAVHFHGNLIQFYQGRQVVARFSETGVLRDPSFNEFADLVDDSALLDPRSYVRAADDGVGIALPADEALLYRKTALEPRGETRPESTLRVRVRRSDGSLEEDWEEVSSLVFSQEDASHFAVETDELGRSFLRFGNGTNGRALPEGAEVHCTYQVGVGTDGNVGADRITQISDAHITSCWNPFDVNDGRAPEPRDEIVRNVPEAFRARQLRAVTLDDYVHRAEELSGVSHAAAQYAWTGSWRTVRVTIDPSGGEELGDVLRDWVTRHLEAVRLLGEDLEIRPPNFVPLTIELVVCVDGEFWPRDVRAELLDAFSSGTTATGTTGFFHPDRWTFGQKLRASQLIGRALQVPGVSTVLDVRMKRWDAPTPGFPAGDVIEVGPSEVIQVRNDPDHQEQGTISLQLKGGRR